MGTEWYYVRDGERVGPRMREEVQALLSTGTLPPDTLVWSPGMASWTPAHSTPELRASQIPNPAPPPVPAGGDQEPHPWRRWCARAVDIGCFALVLGMVSEIVAPGVLLSANDVVLNVVAMAGLFPVEAILLSTFGTTPGKALLGITVTQADGSRLASGTAFNRSFQVWMGGVGFGIPFVTIITQIVGYNRLTKEGATSWDQALDLRVSHAQLSTVRWIGVAVAVVVVVFLAVVGTMYSAS